MARRKTLAKLAELADGVYLAKCRQTNALSAAMSGHSAVWPESKMIVTGDEAVFYRDGEKVWSCNMLYAANNFDVTPASAPEATEWSPGWYTDSGNRLGTAHLYLGLKVDGGSVLSHCGREVSLSNLQPESEALRRCGNCLRHKQ